MSLPVLFAADTHLNNVTVTDLSLLHDYESVFRAHYGRLVRTLTVVSGNREAADDAVQESFVKAHFKWRTISQYDDPVGWIRRVAINKLRDDHRRVTRKDRAIERLANERPELDGEPGLDSLTPMLARLPKQQRLCLAFHYVDGLSVAEIAAALGISDGAVKFHMHSGRTRLRELLGTSESDT